MNIYSRPRPGSLTRVFLIQGRDNWEPNIKLQFCDLALELLPWWYCLLSGIVSNYRTSLIKVTIKLTNFGSIGLVLASTFNIIFLEISSTTTGFSSNFFSFVLIWTERSMFMFMNHFVSNTLNIYSIQCSNEKMVQFQPNSFWQDILYMRGQGDR